MAKGGFDGEARSLRPKTGVDDIVDMWMVEQVEVVRVPEMVEVIMWEIDVPVAGVVAVSTGGGYEQVSEDPPQGMALPRADGRAD
jgi:hypothetical protein